MHLIECFLTTQQEKQKVGQGQWKDCLGIWNSSSKTWEPGVRPPSQNLSAEHYSETQRMGVEALLSARCLLRQTPTLRLTKMHPIELPLRQGLLGPTNLSFFLLSLAGTFMCCLEILSILHWCFFIFNTLLSLYASGKMVKKVCPCNQLCSNYLFFLLLLVLDCKACYPWVLGTLKLHNALIPNFHLSSSAPFSKIF